MLKMSEEQARWHASVVSRSAHWFHAYFGRQMARIADAVANDNGGHCDADLPNQ